MSMIINQTLPKLKKGYPTVSDKYTVRGATLNSASADVVFGDLLEYVGDGSFKKITTTTTVDKIAGVCLATNARPVDALLGDGINKYKAGEVCDLCTGGFIAVEVASSVTLANITAHKPVRLYNGTLVVDSSTGTQIPNWYFTGVTYEDNGAKLAEIVIEKLF